MNATSSFCLSPICERGCVKCASAGPARCKQEERSVQFHRACNYLAGEEDCKRAPRIIQCAVHRSAHVEQHIGEHLHPTAACQHTSTAAAAFVPCFSWKFDGALCTAAQGRTLDAMAALDLARLLTCCLHACCIYELHTGCLHSNTCDMQVSRPQVHSASGQSLPPALCRGCFG
jgi:hypothetical protein